MTRKAGDAIAIGDQVVVRVMEVKGGKVQLGIDAPREVKVAVLEPDAREEPPRK